MAHLLPFIDTAPSHQPPEHFEPSLPLPTSIHAPHKSALLIESNECLTNFLRRRLKEQGYSVRIASTSDEGLRLYRDFGPFNVVLINYCVPQKDGDGIDCLSPQINGIGLALAILNIDSSQGILIAAFDYRSAEEIHRPPEAMQIPILIDILQLRNLLEKIEVDRAINLLARPESLRLQRFAKLLIRAIGRAACGREWEDLLAEAVYRTLIGVEDNQNGRHWNRRVTFSQHLAGAMRSIASLWKRQFRQTNIYLMSELVTCDAEGQERSPFDNIPSQCIPADECLTQKREQDHVFALLEEDQQAGQLLREIMNGLRKNEIKSKLAIDEKQYVAAMRRIRTKLLGGGNRGQDNGR